MPRVYAETKRLYDHCFAHQISGFLTGKRMAQHNLPICSFIFLCNFKAFSVVSKQNPNMLARIVGRALRYLVLYCIIEYVIGEVHYLIDILYRVFLLRTWNL